MNGIRPSLEIEFDDNYIDAKNKLLDFAESYNKLTPAQKDKFAKEFISSIGISASLEQLMKNMNNGGQI